MKKFVIVILIVAILATSLGGCKRLPEGEWVKATYKGWENADKTEGTVQIVVDINDKEHTFCNHGELRVPLDTVILVYLTIDDEIVDWKYIK